MHFFFSSHCIFVFYFVFLFFAVLHQGIELVIIVVFNTLWLFVLVLLLLFCVTGAVEKQFLLLLLTDSHVQLIFAVVCLYPK